LLAISEDVDDLPLLIRRVRVVSGKADIHLRCAVRHDYARTPTQATRVKLATTTMVKNGITEL
jgi:DUF1365 family protein